MKEPSRLWIHMEEVHGTLLLETEEFDIVNAVESDLIGKMQDKSIKIRELEEQNKDLWKEVLQRQKEVKELEDENEKFKARRRDTILALSFALCNKEHAHLRQDVKKLRDELEAEAKAKED